MFATNGTEIEIRVTNHEFLRSSKYFISLSSFHSSGILMLSIQSHGSVPLVKAVVVSERLREVQMAWWMQLTCISDTAQSFCCSLTPTSAPSIKNRTPLGRKASVGLLPYQWCRKLTSITILEMKIPFSTEVLSFCIFNKIQFSKGWSVGFFITFKYCTFHVQE